jgi:4-oxalocrotonate tautomerase
MPFINVKLAGNEATAEQKKKIIEEITNTMVDVLGKNPKMCHVVIECIKTDDWGVGGETITDIRKKLAK